jgi:hypothetical protein
MKKEVWIVQAVQKNLPHKQFWMGSHESRFSL